jgi:hypothetical protein
MDYWQLEQALSETEAADTRDALYENDEDSSSRLPADVLDAETPEPGVRAGHRRRHP